MDDEKAKDQQESDPYFLTQLQAVLAAGAIHTTEILIVNTLFDLATHPHFLVDICDEIRAKHKEINGVWDQAAFNSLYKLDSAMKETIKLTPAGLTACSRMMQTDYNLSNGVTLRKGRIICMSSCSRQKDPSIFPDPETYDAWRAYNQD